MEEFKQAINSIKESLETKIKEIQYELTVTLPAELKKAIDLGDLRENAEYHSAKDRQGILNARLNQLKERLNSLRTLDLNSLPRNRVTLFSTVTLLDYNSDEEVTYYIVLPEMIDEKDKHFIPSKDKNAVAISNTSNIAKTLMGAYLGDEIKLTRNGITSEYEITKIINIEGNEVKN